MTEREAVEIMAAIKELRDEIYKLRQLVIGNGNENAILPRLHAVELFIKSVPTWQRFGDRILTPVITAAITAGLMWVIFGSP